MSKERDEVEHRIEIAERNITRKNTAQMKKEFSKLKKSLKKPKRP